MTENKDELLDFIIEDDRRARLDPEYGVERAVARYQQAAEKLHIYTRGHVVNLFGNAGEFVDGLSKKVLAVEEAYQNVTSALLIRHKVNNGEWYPGFAQDLKK